jgi:hypothetical protein
MQVGPRCAHNRLNMRLFAFTHWVEPIMWRPGLATVDEGTNPPSRVASTSSTVDDRPTPQGTRPRIDDGSVSSGFGAAATLKELFERRATGPLRPDYVWRGGCGQHHVLLRPNLFSRIPIRETRIRPRSPTKESTNVSVPVDDKISIGAEGVPRTYTAEPMSALAVAVGMGIVTRQSNEDEPSGSSVGSSIKSNLNRKDLKRGQSTVTWRCWWKNCKEPVFGGAFYCQNCLRLRTAACSKDGCSKSCQLKVDGVGFRSLCYSCDPRDTGSPLFTTG